MTDPDYADFVTIATLYTVMVLTAIQRVEDDFVVSVQALTTYGIIQVRFTIILSGIFINILISLTKDFAKT